MTDGALEADIAEGACKAGIARGRPLAWPSREGFLEAAALAAGLGALFLAVYFGADAIAGWRGITYRLYLDAELSIPRVPAFIIPYTSMLMLYLVPALQLSIGEIRSLSKRIALAILLCGTIFVAMPTELGFPQTPPGGRFASLYEQLIALDATHNLVPSLHVATSTLVVLALARAARRPLAVLYGVWLVLITLSVVLTHRHHLIDVAAGFAVAALALKLSPPLPPGHARPSSGDTLS